MNYDLNDGIPPYDLPADGAQYDDSGNLTGQGTPSAASDGSANYSNIEADPNMTYDSEVENIYNQEEAVSDPSPKKGSGAKILTPLIILLLVLILGGALYAMYGADLSFSNFSFNKKNTTSENIIDEENTNPNELPNDEVLNNGDETNLALNNNESESVDIDMLKNRHDQVMQGNQDGSSMPVNGNAMGMPNSPSAQNNAQNEVLADVRTIIPRGNVGRLDPFNPTIGGSSLMFDLVMPPVNPEPDPDVQQLMTLKISGIMYTPDSPSAIINIAGSDQLVRKGDKFNGFSVESIGKDKVTVRNGKNTYTASIGESISIDSVGVNAIPNLNKKFAGPYSKGSGKIIEINTLN